MQSVLRAKPLAVFYISILAALFLCYVYLYPLPDRVLLSRALGRNVNIASTADAPTTVLVPPFNCLQNIVTVNDGGRFANKIFEYVSVWSVSKLYGFRPFVPMSVYSTLNDVFEGLSIPPLRDLVGELQEGRCNDTLTEKAILKNEVLDNDLYPVDQYVQAARAQGKPIILRRWIILIDTIVPVLSELRREFRYRSEFRLAAARRLKEFRQVVNRRPGRVSPRVALVGVHVRRTDYPQYLKGRFGVVATAGVDYYLRAAAWMRSVLGADARGGINVGFVVIGDDSAWCLNILVPALNRIAPGRLGAVAAVYAGAGGTTRPGYDLALLSACQHSIISYGTFGIWGALMAGGRTAVYDIHAAVANRHVKENNAAMVFAERLGSWVALP